MRKKLKAPLKLSLQLLLTALLVLQLAIVGCLLNYGHIPLPEQWTNKQLLKQSFNGFHIQAESFRLNLNGEIELTGVRVYSDETTKPIIEADCTNIQYGFSKKGRFRFNLNEILVTNGTLFMPAIYAPKGKRTSILERVTFHLEPTDNRIRINSFAGMHEDIHLRGSIEWPIRSSDSKSEMPPISNIFELSATALKEKARLSPFIKPTLEFSLATQWDDSVDVSLRLSCEELKYNRIQGTYFIFDTAFQLRDKTLIAQSPLFLFAQEITNADINLHAEELSAQVTAERWPKLFAGTLSEFEISAYRLTTTKIKLDSPRIRICPENFSELQFSGSTSGLEGSVAFSGRFDTVKKSGQISANGSIDLYSLIPETNLQKLPQLTFYSNPFYNLTVTLEEGLVLDSAKFRVDVNKVTADGVHFDHILAKGNYGKNGLALKRVLIDRKNQWLNASFRFDTGTDEFQLLLNGLAHPREYNSLLPKWWEDIFENLETAKDAPIFGDFAIYDSTSKRGQSFFFGRAKASNFTYRNANIDSCQLIVRGRKNYIELFEIDAEADSGWATGSLGFTLGTRQQKGLLSIRYSFDASISPEIPAKIIGDEVAKIVDTVELTSLPHIKVNGVTFGKQYPQYQGNSNIYLEANVQAPLTFKQIPLQYLNFKLYIRENDIFLRDVNFGYAKGEATAKIDILELKDEEGKQMCFQLNLKGANQSKAIEDLPGDSTESPSGSSKTELEKQASCTGLLDLNLHAKGPLNDLYGFTGYGDLEIQNEALGSIQLLGPLSKWLRNTRLNFTSFNLDRVDAVFEIDREQILIDNLLIDGPRTCIWVNGTYQLPSQAIDMNVRVGLLANAGTPNSALNRFGNLIATPFPNLLVFNVTGTVHNQRIRSQFDPRNLIPGL